MAQENRRVHGIVQMYDKKRGYGTAEFSGISEIIDGSKSEEIINDLKTPDIILKGITSSSDSYYNTKPKDPPTPEIHFISNLYFKDRATELKEGDKISYVPVQKGMITHATEIEKVENKQSRGRSR